MSKPTHAVLIQFEQQLRQAESDAQLHYVIVNQLRQVVAYEQAFWFSGRESEKPKLAALSDLSQVDRTSPMVAWLERCAINRHQSNQGRVVHVITPSDFPESLAADWSNFSMTHAIWLPLWVPSEPTRREGVLWINRQQPFQESEQALLAHCAQAIAHALFARRKCQLRVGLNQTLKRTRFFQLALVGLGAAMWIPVPQTVLAPAEVVAIDPVVITSPLNAVVESIVVQPNQSIQAGEALVQFDSREWQSERDIAEQALLVAQAQLRTAQQSGLMDARHNARLAELEAEVQLKQSQQDLAQNRVEKTRVLAPSAGLVLLNDPAQWRGKPVSVGERILELADPNQVQIRILLPVADAIAMQPGTPVSLFLNVNPLSAYDAKVRHATFEPELTPEGILAYRVLADLLVPDQLPRIGLRGTAKLYGEQVSLFYYLFRRPITTVRQTLGW